MLVACNAQKKVEGLEKHQHAITTPCNWGAIHNEILMTYFTSFDTTGIKAELIKDISLVTTGGKFDYIKFGDYVMNNVSLFFDLDLWNEAVEVAFENYGVELEDSLDVLTPFCDDLVDMMWDYDGDDSGFDLIANADSSTIMDMLDEYDDEYTTAQWDLLCSLFGIQTDTSKTNLQKAEDIEDAIDLYLTTASPDVQFENQLQFIEDVASLYGQNNIPWQLLDGGAGSDDVVFELYYNMYKQVCHVCGPCPEGISHQRHWNMAVINSAAASCASDAIAGYVFWLQNHQ